jgi:anti-sigma factor RsiW
MTNDNYTEKISLWLDDELDTTEQMKLRQHLSECTDCRQAYEQMKHVDQLLRHAALVMVAPAPGFVHRFEARLADYRPQKMWHIWAALSALLVGALLVVSVWAISSGLALVGLASTVLNVQLLTQSLFVFADTAADFRLFTELGALVLRASLITMRQPVFWGFVVVAAATGGLWAVFMRQLYQRGLVSAKLVF